MSSSPHQFPGNPEANVLSLGALAKDVLVMSGLPPQTLGEIWNLADTNRSGALLFPEFALAMYYCSQALKGQPVPERFARGREARRNQICRRHFF